MIERHYHYTNRTITPKQRSAPGTKTETESCGRSADSSSNSTEKHRQFAYTDAVISDQLHFCQGTWNEDLICMLKLAFSQYPAIHTIYMLAYVTTKLYERLHVDPTEIRSFQKELFSRFLPSKCSVHVNLAAGKPWLCVQK